MKAVAAILNPPPVPGGWSGQRYQTSSAIWRLSGRVTTTISRGPGLEALADSGEGLAILA